MSTVNDNKGKNRIISIIALAFLLFTRFVFCRVELFEQVSVPFIAECVLVFVIYVLTLFNTPLIIQAALSIAGCAALSWFYTVYDGAGKCDAVFPLIYLPAFMFLIDQMLVARGKGDTGFAKVWKWLFRAVPVVLLGAFVFVLLNRKIARILPSYVYIFVIFGLVAVLHVLIMKAKKATSQKKKNTVDEFGSVRPQFIMAAVSLVISSLILIFNSNNYIVQTVPLLWIVNIFYFYDANHPLVTEFVSARAEKIKSFLTKN